MLNRLNVYFKNVLVDDVKEQNCGTVSNRRTDREWEERRCRAPASHNSSNKSPSTDKYFPGLTSEVYVHIRFCKPIATLDPFRWDISKINLNFHSRYCTVFHGPLKTKLGNLVAVPRCLFLSPTFFLPNSLSWSLVADGIIFNRYRKSEKWMAESETPRQILLRYQLVVEGTIGSFFFSIVRSWGQ